MSGSSEVAPSLWALLGRLGRKRWPRLVRGDKDWGWKRRVVVLRRRLPGTVALTRGADGQGELF